MGCQISGVRMDDLQVVEEEQMHMQENPCQASHKKTHLETGFYEQDFDWNAMLERDIHRLGSHQKALKN